MRLTFDTSWCSFDITLFEPAEDAAGEQPQPVVAGAQPDTWPVGQTPDPLQKVDEQGERARRGIGYTA